VVVVVLVVLVVVVMVVMVMREKSGRKGKKRRMGDKGGDEAVLGSLSPVWGSVSLSLREKSE
jgi:preprotein translocase subunit SecG